MSESSKSRLPSGESDSSKRFIKDKRLKSSRNSAIKGCLKLLLITLQQYANSKNRSRIWLIALKITSRKGDTSSYSLLYCMHWKPTPTESKCILNLKCFLAKAQEWLWSIRSYRHYGSTLITYRCDISKHGKKKFCITKSDRCVQSSIPFSLLGNST